MKLKCIIWFFLMLILTASCKRVNDNLSGLLNDPSKPSLEAADVDLYLNNIQINFANFYSSYDNVGNILGVSDFGGQVTRMEVMYFQNTYLNAYFPGNFDQLWTDAYVGVFKSANIMIPLAEEKGEFVHAGIAKVIKAYTMITLVDFFGDIPYSEANLGVANPNPHADHGAVIYDSALALLDSAIIDLGLPSSTAPSNDLFYGGDPAKWTTLAKTLKLKAYVQIRLVDQTVKDKINDLIDEGDLVYTSPEDFAFNFSTHSQSPDSRHPKYLWNYGTDNSAQDYIGNYFMWALDEEKGIVDPRIRYYIYRQIDDVFNDPRLPDQTTAQFDIPCLFRPIPANYPPGTPYCIVGSGYLGRDHGNNEGIPADNGLRSTWGLYPAGGAFDANQNSAVGQSTGFVTGAQGAGIEPIWLSSFTYFIEAEAALILGTPGDPRDLLEKGVNASFDKVSHFASAIGYNLPTSDTAFLITPTKQQKYVDKVLSLYQAAGSSEDKLNVIMKEYYLAAWGNGVEPYNNYRRTGKPDNMQVAVNPAPGDFIRTFYYPAVYVDFNKNTTQKTLTTVKTFWDTNPDNFVH
ncbi:MAG TPA: SusD/RagB family nutrient-binding outer membrane lipoprotein [Puia sp.]